MHIQWWLLIAGLLAGPTFAQRQPEDAVRDALKDPEAARFYDVRRFQNGNACGLVNGKNSYGGYVGKEPFAVVSGKSIFKLALQDACDLAADPAGFKSKLDAQRRRADAAQRDAVNQELAKAAKAAEQRYAECVKHKAAWVEEVKSNLYSLHAPLPAESISSMAGDVSPAQLSACPLHFKAEVAAEVEPERLRLFNLYCVLRKDQRTREYVYYQHHHSRIREICGNPYFKDLVSATTAEQAAAIDKAWASNRLVADCRMVRDYALVGDRATRRYWERELADRCASVQDMLD